MYHELYNMVTDGEAKKILSQVLREEKMHLVQLREEYEDIG